RFAAPIGHDHATAHSADTALLLDRRGRCNNARRTGAQALRELARRVVALAGCGSLSATTFPFLRGTSRPTPTPGRMTSAHVHCLPSLSRGSHALIDVCR